ncbi:MAG: hypothetical protein VCD66_00965 [Alphaproteobacteria bacterium]
MSAPLRQRAVIVFADAGGPAPSRQAEEATARDRFKELADEIFKPLLKQYRGRLVKTMGEGFVMTFTSAVAAVSFAIDVQRTLPVHQSQWPERRRLRFRMGVDLGDIIADGGDVRGGGVTAASGLRVLAAPGGMVISGAVFDQAHRRLDQVAFQEMEAPTVEHNSGPVRAYKVLLDPSALEKIAKRPSMFSGRRIATVLLTLIILAGAALWKLRPWD